MATPFFTVAMPTKNRPDRLRNALRSVVSQTFPDFEIIVCDNSDLPDVSPSTEVVRSFADPRIRYIRTNGQLSMADNWERTCAGAEGEFVLILTDRSVLRRDALEIVHGDIVNTGARVVMWGNDIYGRYPDEKVFARRMRSRARHHFTSRDLLNYFLHGPPKTSVKYLPKLLTSCCARSILAEIRAAVGTCFLPVSPDYTQALLVLSFSDWVLFIDDSLYTSCGTGNGSSFRQRGALAARFLEDMGMTFADLVDRMPSPACFSHATIMNDFMRVKEAAPERFEGFDFDRIQYYVGCLVDYSKSARRGVDLTADLELLLTTLQLEDDTVRRAVRADRHFIRALVTRPNLAESPTANSPSWHGRGRPSGRTRQEAVTDLDADTDGFQDGEEPLRFETVFEALTWAEANPLAPGGPAHLDGDLQHLSIDPERAWWKRRRGRHE